LPPVTLRAPGRELPCSGSGHPGDYRGKEDPMEPVLPDAPLEESEFDLDVRLQPIARDASDELQASEGKTVCCPPEDTFVCTEGCR
jgi:hypothetical protein